MCQTQCTRKKCLFCTHLVDVNNAIFSRSSTPTGYYYKTKYFHHAAGKSKIVPVGKLTRSYVLLRIIFPFPILLIQYVHSLCSSFLFAANGTWGFKDVYVLICCTLTVAPLCLARNHDMVHFVHRRSSPTLSLLCHTAVYVCVLGLVGSCS